MLDFHIGVVSRMYISYNTPFHLEQSIHTVANFCFLKVPIGENHKVKGSVHLVFLSLEQKLDKLLSPFPTNCRNLYATEYGRAEHVHYFVTNTPCQLGFKKKKKRLERKGGGSVQLTEFVDRADLFFLGCSTCTCSCTRRTRRQTTLRFRSL